MIKKSIVPAMLCSLLSTTALAGELTIDIDTRVATPTPESSNPLVDTFELNIAPVNVRVGYIDPSITPAPTNSVDLQLQLGNLVSPGVSTNSNNVSESDAIVNARTDTNTGEYVGNNLNIVEFDPTSGYSDAEAMLAAINVNTGEVNASVENVNSYVGAGAVTGGAAIEVSNNVARSRIIINGQDNYVTGDASSHSPIGSTTSGEATFDANTPELNAVGDIVIVAYQGNEAGGTANAKTATIDMSIDVASLGADATDEVSLSIDSNAVYAMNEINDLNNIIDLEHTGLELRFAIASYQSNNAAVMATAGTANLDMTVAGEAFGDMTISNNDVYAYNVVNTMSNQVMSESGGEDFKLFAYLGQSNSEAVTGLASGANMFMTVGTSSVPTSTHGAMAISNNNVYSYSRVNEMNNSIVSDSGGAAFAATLNVNQSNAAAVSDSVAGVNMYMDIYGSANGVMAISNNDVYAYSLVNEMTNQIVSESGAAGFAATLNVNQSNSGGVSDSVAGVDMSMEVLGSTNGDMTTSNNDVYAYSLVNTMTNQIQKDSGGEDFILNASLNQTNSAAVQDTVADVNMSMSAAPDAGDLANGAMSISNNNVYAYSHVNAMVNRLTGDSSAENVNINLSLSQLNSETITAMVSDADMSMTATAAASTNPLTGDMSVMNNSVSADALANSMYSEVEFGGAAGNTPSAANRFSVKQSNEAEVLASISNVDMGLSVPGITSSSVSVRGNSISASASVNSSINIVRLR